LKNSTKNISSDAKQYYIKGKYDARQIKKYPRTSKLKNIHRTKLISDFTLNSDNYDIEVSYVVRSKISKILRLE
jgi:hypothetical protein